MGGFDPLLSLCLASNPPVRPGALWSAWSLAPEVVLPLLAMLGAYILGLRRVAARRPWDRPNGRHVACFAAGWLMLAVAVVSPLCRMAATLVWAHMAQHALLVAVAPPLLVLGVPSVMIAEALPPRWQALAARCVAATRRWMGTVVVGAAYGAGIWLWHLPALYQGALLSEGLHLAMYASLLAVSLLFWRTALRPDAMENTSGGTLLLLLVTPMHTSLLGALLTVAREPWYPVLAPYAAVWRLTPLEDQQLAGLIMWVPMGVIYPVAALGLMIAWFRAMDRQARSSV